MCSDRFVASSHVHKLTRGGYGLEDFKLEVTDYIESVDTAIDETRASLPEKERNGAVMKEYEEVCQCKLTRQLDLVRYSARNADLPRNPCTADEYR